MSLQRAFRNPQKTLESNGKARSEKVNKDQKKAALRMSLKKMLFAHFSGDRLCLSELRSALEQDKTWVNKYLTPEQQQKMAEISNQSYSPEAAQKLAQWSKNWTEEDQKRASQQWHAVFTELRRLVANGEDPTSPGGQALAKQHRELIMQFTHGEAGLKQWWKISNELPAGEKPLARYSYSEEEATFLQKALEYYKQGQQ